MFHETIEHIRLKPFRLHAHAPLRIEADRQANGHVSDQGEGGQKRKKEPWLLLTAMTSLERHAEMRYGAGRGNRTLN